MKCFVKLILIVKLGLLLRFDVAIESNRSEKWKISFVLYCVSIKWKHFWIIE